MKKPRNNFRFKLVWKGKKPNRTWSVRTGFRFGSVRFKNLKKNNFGLIAFFGPKPDQTENAQP